VKGSAASVALGVLYFILKCAEACHINLFFLEPSGEGNYNLLEEAAVPITDEIKVALNKINYIPANNIVFFGSNLVYISQADGWCYTIMGAYSQ
jgi:hypothetical protein